MTTGKNSLLRDLQADDLQFSLTEGVALPSFPKSSSGRNAGRKYLYIHWRRETSRNALFRQTERVSLTGEYDKLIWLILNPAKLQAIVFQILTKGFNDLGCTFVCCLLSFYTQNVNSTLVANY